MGLGSRSILYNYTIYIIWYCLYKLENSLSAGDEIWRIVGVYVNTL